MVFSKKPFIWWSLDLQGLHPQDFLAPSNRSLVGSCSKYGSLAEPRWTCFRDIPEIHFESVVESMTHVNISNMIN